MVLTDVVDAAVVEVAEEDDNDNVNPNLNLETWNKISLPKQGGRGWVSQEIHTGDARHSGRRHLSRPHQH